LPRVVNRLRSYSCAALAPSCAALAPSCAALAPSCAALAGLLRGPGGRPAQPWRRPARPWRPCCVAPAAVLRSLGAPSSGPPAHPFLCPNVRYGGSYAAPGTLLRTPIGVLSHSFVAPTRPPRPPNAAAAPSCAADAPSKAAPTPSCAPRWMPCTTMARSLRLLVAPPLDGVVEKLPHPAGMMEPPRHHKTPRFLLLVSCALLA
jgi:hypothetical protein